MYYKLIHYFWYDSMLNGDLLFCTTNPLQSQSQGVPVPEPEQLQPRCCRGAVSNAPVPTEIQGLQVLHDLGMWDTPGKQAAQGSVLEWGIEAAVRHTFSVFWTSQSTIAEPFLSLCVSIDCNINFYPLLPPDIDFPPQALWLSSPFWQQGGISVSVFIQFPAWRETDFLLDL